MIETPPLIGPTGDPQTDPAAFARDVLGLPPHDYEVPALHSTAPNVVLLGGRRSGKTWVSQVRALHSCLTRRDSRWLVTAPNRDKVRLYLTECADLLRDVPAAAGAVLDEQRDRITFANGAELLGLPPTPGQLRGYGRGVLGLTLDEAGFIGSQVWRDAAWCLLENRQHGAQAFLVSTPWGPADHPLRRAFDLGMAGDDDYEAFRWPSTLNPAVSAEWVERERQRIAPSEAAAELDGEWSDAAGSMFPRSLLDACTADVPALDLAELQGPARVAVGCDFGVSYDRSAVVCIGRLPVAGLNDAEVLPPGPVFGIVGVRVFDVGAPLRDVSDAVVGSPAALAMVCAETNGVGAGPAQAIYRGLADRLSEENRASVRAGHGHLHGYKRHPLHMTAPRKLAAYGGLRWLMESGRFVIPRGAPEVLRQLAGLTFRQGERGHVALEAADPAVHDDAADAVALALGPMETRGGHPTTWLQSCGLRTADTELPTGTPSVETGAGVRVPVGVFQSCDGGELTAPPATPSPRTDLGALVSAALARNERQTK